MTISLGLNADTTLMQQIADITGGKHFNVPGGGTIDECERTEGSVHREIAADRRCDCYSRQRIELAHDRGPVCKQPVVT